MMTLEELHAHYKAVRARLDKPPKREPAVRLVYSAPGPYPDPLDSPPPFVAAFNEPAKAPPEVAETPSRKILMEVAEKHKMPVGAFRSPSRKVPFVSLRHEACYRLSTELNFSLMQIGRLMGNRDHTTVLNAIRRHKKILAEGYKPQTRKRRVGATQVEPQSQHDHG